MTLTNDDPARGGMMEQAKQHCIRSMHLMVNGTRQQFDEVVHPEAINREGEDEPPESRGKGPAAFYATALWLREWFSELAFDVHESSPRATS